MFMPLLEIVYTGALYKFNDLLLSRPDQDLGPSSTAILSPGLSPELIAST
jgi:hypothetical protein